MYLVCIRLVKITYVSVLYVVERLKQEVDLSVIFVAAISIAIVDDIFNAEMYNEYIIK